MQKTFSFPKVNKYMLFLRIVLAEMFKDQQSRKVGLLGFDVGAEKKNILLSSPAAQRCKLFALVGISRCF